MYRSLNVREVLCVACVDGCFVCNVPTHPLVLQWACLLAYTIRGDLSYNLCLEERLSVLKEKKHVLA